MKYRLYAYTSWRYWLPFKWSSPLRDIKGDKQKHTWALIFGPFRIFHYEDHR